MMREHDHVDVILEEGAGIYEKRDTLKSFHHQACQPISRKALLAGFLSVWLKRCVVPSPPHDAILPTILLPAIRLVHSRSLGLLLAMVCCIQQGLRILTVAICRPPVTKRGKETVLPRDGSNPRVGMPYTYLMAWFALHCPTIIQPGEEPLEGVRIAHLCRFEGSSCERSYVVGVRKLLYRHNAYSLFRCFPYIRDASYGEEFKDARDGITSLGRGVLE